MAEATDFPDSDFCRMETGKLACAAALITIVQRSIVGLRHRPHGPKNTIMENSPLRDWAKAVPFHPFTVTISNGRQIL